MPGMRNAVAAWDRFFFTPRPPHALAVLRVVTGLMLAYSHAVWWTEVAAFFGPDAWIDSKAARSLAGGDVSPSGPSYLTAIESMPLLHLHQAIAVIAALMLAAGCLTRIVAPMCWLMQLAVVHRLGGMLFGLDQIVLYAAMYLTVADPGGAWSIDRRLVDRFGPRWWLPNVSANVRNNVATRLMQIHLCVIYLFGGLAKSRGVTWWDGTATWYSVASGDYQSLDMLWITDWPWLFSAITHATLFLELSYVALIWPRLTRPIVLAGVVAMHAGIAAFLGMMTFGVMMIVANVVFVPAAWFERIRPDVAPEPEPSTDIPDDASPDDLRRIRDDLRSRERTYRDKLSKLKSREAKLKELAERRRDRGS